MPTRYLKESITTSDTLAGLSAEGERFFYRLLVKVDDFGVYDARLAVLRAHCFSVMLDLVSEQDIARWLNELEQVGLARVYTVDGRPYVQILTMTKHNKPRADNSKYPSPPDAAGNGGQMQAVADNCMQVPESADKREQTQASATDATQSESKSESKSESRESAAAARAGPPPKADKPAKTARAPNPNYELAAALAEVCGMELEPNKGRLLKEAGQLKACSPPPSPQEVRHRYGKEGWWWSDDWRGQRGEWPSPATVRETWGRWTKPTPRPTRKGGNGHAKTGLAAAAGAPARDDPGELARTRAQWDAWNATQAGHPAQPPS